MWNRMKTSELLEQEFDIVMSDITYNTLQNAQIYFLNMQSEEAIYVYFTLRKPSSCFRAFSNHKTVGNKIDSWQNI
jgi:hypothetical protein